MDPVCQLLPAQADLTPEVRRRDATVKISIVIPTYRRNDVLVDTIRHVSTLTPAAHEIIVADQTERHDQATGALLGDWHAQGLIRLLRLSAPSVTHAMNAGLLAATGDVVLFLDDDIIPELGLVEAHRSAHALDKGDLIAGRVIQPWQAVSSTDDDAQTGFASTQAGPIMQFIGCNFSIPRKLAIDLGGFDENFLRVAYNFEAEFAHRLRRAGHQIYFEPQACLHHLKVPSGGTRTFGDHLTTTRGDHAVGAYYCLLRTWHGWRSLGALAYRPLRAIMTRHHLRRPWWIPVTLFAELRGLLWAVVLAARGPRYIRTERVPGGPA